MNNRLCEKEIQRDNGNVGEIPCQSDNSITGEVLNTRHC